MGFMARKHRLNNDDPEDFWYTIERIQNCIIDIKAWMTANFPKQDQDHCH